MIGSLPGARAMRQLAGSATVAYLAVLAMSGIAILLTVALPPGERGLLVATTTSAAVGAAIGGLSLETFLLAQGRRWLDQAGRRSLTLYLGTVPLAAVLGWLLARYTSEAVPGLSAVGAACVAASNLPAAVGLTRGRFISVYRLRAAFAAVTPAVFLLFIVLPVRSATAWMLTWLGSQALLALALWIGHGGPLGAMARRTATNPERLARLGVTHTGAVAQVFTYRFDQLALARYQGPDELAVYSLAVAAIEFSQAGAVVAAQRTLGDHEQGSAQRFRALLRRTVGVVLGIGLLALIGLAVIGWLAPGYVAALVLGAILLPRSGAVAVGKILSARLVNLGRERATAVIAVATAITAVLAYALVAPRYGAAGVAAVSVVLFALHSTVTALVVRAQPTPVASATPGTLSRVGSGG
ncbi:MAG TPA: hypothetical protein VK453_01965 [Micromonosporaceae bacterium]|nr:hypothetical protein [Micromonosporaceae bacterium]